ncbi:MAG: hypothetical protein WB613_09630, partial [Pseudolabrys sp.]
MILCPGRSAARSDALQTQDRNKYEHAKVPDQRRTTTLRFVLHRIRDKRLQMTDDVSRNERI